MGKDQQNRNKMCMPEPEPVAHTAPSPGIGNAETQARMQTFLGMEQGHHPLGTGGIQSVDVREDGVDFNAFEMSGESGGQTATGPFLRGSAGQLNRDPDGPRRWGVRGEGGLGGVELAGGEDHGLELNTPHGELEASIGEDGMTFGGGGTLLEANGRNRFRGAGDTRATYGLGAEENAGVRVHWGDSDNDGRRNLGFGLSAGPAHFDVTTEILSDLWSSFGGN